MNELLKQISSYHIFNYLLPGCLFAIATEKLALLRVANSNVLVALALYYFLGLIISRIGSVILEPLLEVVRFIKRAKYADYVRASMADPKLDVLSESNNMYRTLGSMVLYTMFLWLYKRAATALGMPGRTNTIMLCIFLLALFLFSYRKQTSYITERVSATISTNLPSDNS